MPRRCTPIILLCCCLLARPAAAAATEVALDARALLDAAVTRDVRLAAGGNAIELDRGELVEDDGPAAGYSYKPNEERLSGGVRVKKDLLIPDPRSIAATLLVGGKGPFQAIINGREVPLQPGRKAGGYWDAYPLPPDALVAGKNQVVLHGGGRLWIARDDEFAGGSRERAKHPNRSARSGDGGRTWDYDRLGPDGSIDGEYYVRLFLDRHRPAGSLVLPVLDAGNLAGRAVADPIGSVPPVRVRVDAEVGAAGRAMVRTRAGPTPVPGEGWSVWQALPAGGAVERPAGRYVQVAVDLATSDPRMSPTLRQVVVEASPESAGDWARGLRVVEQRNERIVRSSVRFEYEAFDHPRLKELRERHKLDDVVRGAAGEFELITRLAAWSSRLWAKGHLGEAYPAWDALAILAPHPVDGRPVGGFCHQYNLVFLQACESFGIPGRAVSLGPGGLLDKPRRGGHEVVELWSNEHRKWVYVDGQLAWYAVDAATGVPLSLLALRERQLALLAGRPSEPVRVVKVAAQDREDWQSLDKGVPFGELRLIPRSNFLAERSPLPLNQGMRGWFWTGHYVWTDDQLPAAELYGHRVRGRSNWEWTLNQAHVILEATRTPGELRVHLDTETPGFATFVADVDGAGWRPVASGFAWQLRPGRNRLEVRPRNLAGRDGIVSRFVLDLAPPVPVVPGK